MSIEIENAPDAARSAGAHPLGVALVGHLVAAALLWGVISAPDRTVVYNEDFVRWAWLAVLLGAALAAGVGVWRRSWKSTALAGLGVGAALVLELAMFLVWIISHSQ